MNTETLGAAVAPATEETFELPRHAARYAGSTELAGVTPNSDGEILGEYWEQEGVFLFQPTGTTLIFEVSDEDIIRVGS